MRRAAVKATNPCKACALFRTGDGKQGVCLVDPIRRSGSLPGCEHHQDTRRLWHT